MKTLRSVWSNVFAGAAAVRPAIAIARVDLPARQRVPGGDVARAVHRHAPHPTALAVGRVGALVHDRPSGAVVHQLVPAQAGFLLPGLHGVGHDEPFIRGTQLAVLQAEHQPVVQGIELVRRAALADAVGAASAADPRVEVRRGDIVDVAERAGVGRPVDLVLPHLELVVGVAPLVGVDLHEDVRLVRPGRQRAVGVGGQLPSEVRVDRVQVRVDLSRGVAGDHRVALVGDRASTAPCEVAHGRAAAELVERREVGRVVRGRPHAELRVIVQDVRVRIVELVRHPRARGVARVRHRDALREPGLAEVQRELRDDPHVGVLVVDHDRVAIVVRGAELLGRRVEHRRHEDGPIDLRPVGGVVDRERDVHHLQVVAAAHVAVRVWRHELEGVRGRTETPDVDVGRRDLAATRLGLQGLVGLVERGVRTERRTRLVAADLFLTLESQLPLHPRHARRRVLRQRCERRRAMRHRDLAGDRRGRGAADPARGAERGVAVRAERAHRTVRRGGCAGRRERHGPRHQAECRRGRGGSDPEPFH